jgi:hypothetical protein
MERRGGRTGFRQVKLLLEKIGYEAEEGDETA